MTLPRPYPRDYLPAVDGRVTRRAEHRPGAPDPPPPDPQDAGSAPLAGDERHANVELEGGPVHREGRDDPFPQAP